MERFLINDKIHALTCFLPNMDSIILYCHGFGESKECILRHSEILNDNNIGIIGFDFPSHGEEDINYHILDYDNCLEYVNIVYNYIVNKYSNIPVYLMGASFGGYMALSFINELNLDTKVFLTYPAVNFYENLINKMNLDLSYFNNNDSFYFEKVGYTLYKDCFESFYKHDIRNTFNNKSDVYILHGSIDHTVLLKDVELFCKKYNIKLKIIENEKHGLLNSLDIVNNELLSFFNK